jgi:DNA-binding winged helix-turn-helix (wHTH) protein
VKRFTAVRAADADPEVASRVEVASMCTNPQYHGYETNEGVQIDFSHWTLDLCSCELRRGGVPVQLRRQLRDVLCHLARNRHRVVTRDELRAEVWRGVHVTTAAVYQAVKDLRRALGDDGRGQAIIRTVRGRGYRFSGDRVR